MQIALPTGTRGNFIARGDFAKDLDAAAGVYFATRRRHDLPRMYVKTFILLAWFVASWVGLVFFSQNAWQAALGAVSLGLSIAGIGMAIQHDANHGAYSKHRIVNRILGATLDLMGVASFIWRPKHNVGHHTFTNVEGRDFDLDFGSVARLSPTQGHRPWHRYQHVYLWFLYGALLPKWVFHDDFAILKSGFIGTNKLPPPNRRALAGFVFWKLGFIAWAIVIPCIFHPMWQVFLFHALAAFTLGATLGTIFQLAHCTGEATFPAGVTDTDFASHQLATTVDFAPKSAILTWFVGGLNYQVEHHLFPKVCHLHYPALSLVVAEVAARHGLRHRTHRTLCSALGAHFTHLRAMGNPSAS